MPTDALALLTSALKHCKDADIRWIYKQEKDYLLLVVPKAHIASNGNGEISILPLLATENK